MNISILIPYYYGSTFIQHCIRSVFTSLERTRLSAEIIILNDSPDDHWSVGEYENDRRLRIETNTENTGIACARNRLFKLSYGEFVVFLDQDDRVCPWFFEVIESNLKRADLIIGNLDIYYEATKKKRKMNRPGFKLFLQVMNERRMLRFGPIFKTVSQFVYHRKLFKPFIQTKAQGADDFFTAIDLISNAQKMVYRSDSFITYYIHDANYSKQADFYASLREGFQLFNEKHGGRYTGDEKFFIAKNRLVLGFRRIALLFFQRR